MFGFLKKALGASDGPGGKAAAIIREDLIRLDKARPKLGQQALEYVFTGEGGTVLSTLANTQIPQGLLGVNRVLRNHSAAHEMVLPSDVFADLEPYDVDLIARYAEVTSPTLAYFGGPSSCGPDTLPEVMQDYFRMVATSASEQGYFGGNTTPRRSPLRGATPEMVMAVGARLGAKPAEVAALFFWKHGRYGNLDANGYRGTVDMRSFVAANRDLIIEAAQHLTPDGKVVLLRWLKKNNLASEAPFTGLVFDLAGDTGKAAREAATDVILSLPKDMAETQAAALLSKSNAATRAGMVSVLAALGTDTALETLKAHAKTEKTARITSAIENALLASGTAGADGDAEQDDMMGYTAIDGSRIEIPPHKVLKDDPSVTVTAEQEAQILKAVEAFNAHSRERNAKDTARSRGGTGWPVLKSPKDTAKRIAQQLNTGDFPSSNGLENRPIHALEYGDKPAYEAILAGLPPHRVMRIYIGATSLYFADLCSMQLYPGGPVITDWLCSEDGDLRVLEDIFAKNNLRENPIKNRARQPFGKGGFIYEILSDQERWYAFRIADIPDAALWPYLAEHLDKIDIALGLAPKGDFELSKSAAITMLGKFPKAPMRYLGVLLDIATGETKDGRAEARAMLDDMPGLDARLIELLGDSRQGVRAGAADWLAKRGSKDAVKAMKARLKKEKSELAKAAILTALSRMDEDLSSFVGPAALVKEAEAGLKKAKLDKLDWLGLDALPNLTWANGKPVPDEVPRWWLALALKLKQPGGNALFEIYLDQLSPGSAEAFSAWIFDSWVSHDTARPSDADGTAYANQHAPQRLQSWSRWRKDLTLEMCFDEIKREFMGQYLNSGTDSKGILGLATRVPAAHSAERVRNYLRQHGKRTSQATSLLELLAAKGDAISLQVVIAAATRLKQKGVQAKAGDMVNAIAEARGWSMAELADRTVPTGGLDDDGTMELVCGPQEKVYTATLGDDLTLIVTNPDGKIVKALPAGDDDATKEAKKQLSASKKELKQVIKAQSERLYEAVCAERVWTTEDWQRDFHDHPVMRRLIERVVWLGLDADGVTKGAFRPTAEGEFTDAEDNPIDVTDFTKLRLAHGALMTPDAANAWQEHLKDYEVTPLFGQFGRALLHLPDDMENAKDITDRLGWVSDTFTVRGHASKLGYERGSPMDGGFFNEYCKPFKSAGLTAIVEFSGNCLPEENMAAAIKTLYFVRQYQQYNRSGKVALKDVPPVLLSECWNDYRDMAAKAAFDPDWEKKMPW